MSRFADKRLPISPDVIAPDGSQVRVLLALARGSMAHFRLAAGAVARAVRHRTVEEIWYVVAGNGEIWRSQDGVAAVTELAAGLCVTIPAGTAFQFRAGSGGALDIIGVTMPPWPGDGETEPAPGPWAATV